MTLKCCSKMAKSELVVGRPWNAARRWWNVNLWLQEPSNAAGRLRNMNLWLQEPWNQEFHVPDTTPAGAGFSTHCCLKWCCVFVKNCNYHLFFLRGKWNSKYDWKIMGKVYFKRFCLCPPVKIMWVKVMTIRTVKFLLLSIIGQTTKCEIRP